MSALASPLCIGQVVKEEAIRVTEMHACSLLQITFRSSSLTMKTPALATARASALAGTLKQTRDPMNNHGSCCTGGKYSTVADSEGNSVLTGEANSFTIT